MVSSNSSLLFQKSCLAPLILEPSVSTQQLAPSKQDLVLPLSKKQSEETELVSQKHCPPTGNNNGSWDFFQAPEKTPSYNCKPTTTNDTVYVHPLTKSCSWMSTRSLEMCTETLGSETGTHIMDEVTYLAMEKRSTCGSEETTTKTCKKIKHVTSFPPPLTSIVGGRGGVEMRARREEGRLVIEAVASSSSSRSCFKAERENGRLRLSLVKDECNNLGFEKEEKEVEVEVVNKCREDGPRVGRRIGGGEWPSSRCSGDGSGCRNNLSSLPFYVAIS